MAAITVPALAGAAPKVVTLPLKVDVNLSDVGNARALGINLIQFFWLQHQGLAPMVIGQLHPGVTWSPTQWAAYEAGIMRGFAGPAVATPKPAAAPAPRPPTPLQSGPKAATPEQAAAAAAAILRSQQVSARFYTPGMYTTAAPMLPSSAARWSGARPVLPTAARGWIPTPSVVSVPAAPAPIARAPVTPAPAPITPAPRPVALTPGAVALAPAAAAPGLQPYQPYQAATDFTAPAAAPAAPTAAPAPSGLTTLESSPWLIIALVIGAFFVLGRKK